MKRFRTTSCRAFGQPEISFLIDERLGDQSSWLVDYFEQAAAGGKRFRPGETIQFGASILKIASAEGGDLELLEPELGVIPIAWRKGITEASRHLILQRSVAEVLGSEPSFPSYLDPARVEEAVFQPRSSISMKREKRSGTAMEWSFKRGDGERSATSDHSLFEVISGSRDVIPFLALPSPAVVYLEQGRVQIESGGRTASSDTDGHLRRVLESLSVSFQA